MGLEVSGTAVGNNFCLADEAKRAEQVAMTKSWIDNSVKLGSPCMRVFAGGVPSGHTEQEARKWCIDSLKECLDYAKPRGILLALENHGGITSTADQILSIIKAVDDEWLGVNLDTGNYRNAYEDIKKTAPYAITCHAKTEIPGPSGKEIADFRKIVGDKWHPGLNAPFDPVASKMAEKLKMGFVYGNDSNGENAFSPHDVFNYMYSIFFSRS